MARSFRTWSLTALLFCLTAGLVGCGGGDKDKGPKVKGDDPGLKERPAPVSPAEGGGKKGTTTPGAGPTVQ